MTDIKKYLVYLNLPEIESMILESDNVEMVNGSLLFYLEDQLYVGFAQGFWKQIQLIQEE